MHFNVEFKVISHWVVFFLNYYELTLKLMILISCFLFLILSIFISTMTLSAFCQQTTLQMVGYETNVSVGVKAQGVERDRHSCLHGGALARGLRYYLILLVYPRTAVQNHNLSDSGGFREGIAALISPRFPATGGQKSSLVRAQQRE